MLRSFAWMRAGYRPERRNRNIGTPKQGHGQDNRLVIPSSRFESRAFYECIETPTVVQRELFGRTLRFVVEPLRPGCAHACSIDDISEVFSHVPVADREGLDLIVLRQPKRKEQILKPVWGRLVYFGHFGPESGAAIVLEAVEPESKLVWSSSLTPDDQREFDRLRDDGHDFNRVGRRYVATMNASAARATQLYRTILHEIGHWVDFLESVRRPSQRDESANYCQLSEAYHSKPTAEKEAFAHRYANTLGNALKKQGVFPFGV